MKTPHKISRRNEFSSQRPGNGFHGLQRRVGVRRLAAAWTVALVAGFGSFSQGAVITHLDVDFSGYTLGNVAGQSGQVSGAWTDGGASWVGNVVANTYPGGAQSLEVYRTSGGGAGGRGSVALANGNLSLTSESKIYFSLDLYTPASTGTLDVAFSTGSYGTGSNLGFGVRLNSTSNALSFLSSTSGGIPVWTPGSLTPAADTWYRLEFEISQSATAGQGLFTVYASSESGGSRTAVLSNQAYTFTNTSLAQLNTVPLTDGSAANAVEINNLVVQSGLDSFPVNPIPEPASGVLLGASAVALMCLRRRKTA